MLLTEPGYEPIADVANPAMLGQARAVTEHDPSEADSPKVNETSGNSTATAVGSTGLPTADEVAERDFGAHRLRLSPLTAIIGAVVVASFGIWVYAYSGAADRPPPDVLESNEFATKAEPICAAALLDLEKIPDASLARTAAERSVELRAATEGLEVMLDDLDELEVPQESARDSGLRAEWTKNWRIYLADRYRFADALLVNPEARFLISDVGVSESPERRLTRFATVNKMESCGTPGDAG